MGCVVLVRERGPQREAEQGSEKEKAAEIIGGYGRKVDKEEPSKRTRSRMDHAPALV